MRPAIFKFLAPLLCCAAAFAPHADSQTTTLFTISAPSPAAAPAGSGAINVSLTVRQNLDTTFLQQYGFCLYTGVASNAVARNSPTTTASPTFTVPASDFDIPPTSFAAGRYTAYLNMQVVGVACSATSTLSNSIAFPITFPTISSVSLAALPQPNSGVAFATYPTSLEINGTNLNSGTGANFTFTSQTTPGIAYKAGAYLPSVGSTVVPIPAIYETGATGVTISACNNSADYRYCSATTSLASFPLATTATQVASSIAGPTVGQTTTLTAKVTHGAGSTTAGGIYAPGTPSGTVTFTDGTTTLGTAPLVGSSLTFATATPQTINAAGQFSDIIKPAKAQSRVHPPRPTDTPMPDGSGTFSSIVADFNLDGVKDVLIVDSSSGKFHLMLGASPTGNFRPDQTIASGCSYYLSAAAVADLNGDGFPDIAVLCANENSTATLFALYNLGDGTFGPATPVLSATGAPLLGNGELIGSGDLNKDGKIDLVVTGPTSTGDENTTYGIQTFFGDGAGHFTVGPVTVTSGDPGSQLIVKDLNNDGAFDLVLFNSDYEVYTSYVQPYGNNGSGTFTTASKIPVCTCYTYTAKLFVTPLTANTLYPDILVSAPDQAQALIALNKGTAALAFAPAIARSIPNLADAVMGDLNGDTLADLVVFDGTSITVLNGDGAGNFATQPSSPNFTATGYSAANVTLVSATDMNQDGYADLVAIYPGTTFSSTINTFLTSGTAVASLPATFSTATTHSIATSYPGNVNLLGSNGALSLAVTQPPPAYTASLAITAPPSTAPGASATRVYTPGGTFSLSFTVTQTTDPSQGRGYRTPGGTITVSEGSANLGSVSPAFSAPGVSTASLNNFGSATTGVHTFTIAYTGDTNFSPITTTYTYTVTPAVPVITWSTPANINTNTPLDSSILNATAGVPGSFRYTPAAGYLSPGTQTVSALFTPTDAVDYQAITTNRTINVLKVNPSSSALTASPTTQTYLSSTPTVLTATIAGLNITPTGTVQFFDGANLLGNPGLSSTTSPATAAATMSLASLAAGPHAFRAVYSGDAVYNAVTNTLSYTVGAAAPVLAYTPIPASITYGTALLATQLNATAKTAAGTTIPGAFTYNHAIGDLLTAGTQTLTATFTPTDTTSFQSGTVQAPITVNKATPVVTWNPATPFPVNKPIDSTILNATANVPGTFAYPFTAGSFFPVEDQFPTVTFTPTDATDYTTATATHEINGIKATTVATLTVSPTTQTAASTIPTVLTATLTGLSFNPGGTVQFFDGANSLGTVNVANAPNSGAIATFSIATLSAITHTFKAVYSGDNTYNTATSNTLSYAVGAAAPVLAYTPIPATIPYGTALVATQLNATAKTAAGTTIPGTFAYNHAIGDILTVGTQTLTATFTPTDTTSFQSGTVQAPITVLQATTTTNTLTVTAGGNLVTTIRSGAVITLTATVSATTGQVNFCDASAAFCTDVHLLGTAQLTTAGTATFRFIPAIGTHTYRAIFLGTTNNAAATSATVPLTVTGTFPTTTTLATSGTPTNYVLTATVVGSGSPTLTPTGTVSFLDASNANNPVATAPLGAATTAQTFTTQPASGIAGSILATADFNGDGIPDVLTGTSPSGTTYPVNQTLSVYLGNGDGTFTLKSTVNIPVGQAVTGDFNHDGITDIALSSAAANTVSILLGNGDGTFTLKATNTVPGGLGTLLVADFNHDGLLDLATGSTTTRSNPDSNTTTFTGTLTVLLGAGDGTFRSVQTSTTVGASSLATADFNGDGIPDLVAGDFFAQTATIFLGKGDGTFSLKATNTIQNAQDAALFTTADFNGDGIADIAALDFYNNTVTILIGHGDGTFDQKPSFTDPTTVGDPDSFNIATGDFNQDGIADLAVTSDDGVSVYLGAGDGTFSISTRAIPQTLATQEQGHEDFGLLLADFNGDGLLDIATTAPNFTIALNTITATATATASNITLTGYGPHPITASYPGDTNFAAGASAPTSLTGQPITPVLTLNPTPSTLTYGTLLPATLFNATATTATGAAIPGTIAYNHAVGDLLTAGSQVLTATFTPADALSYTILSVSRTLTITRATPTLTWTPPAPITQGTPLSSTQLNATAAGYNGTTLPGAFAYTPAAAQVLPSGVQTLSVTFTPTDIVDYLTATTSVPLTVNIPPARATLTSSANPTQYGQPTTLTATILPGGTLTAIPTGSVSFSDGTRPLATVNLSPTGVAILPVSTLTAGTHTITATYLGDTANAASAAATLSQIVIQAIPTITFNPNPSTIPYGAAITAAQLNATVTSAYIPAVPGTFTYAYAPTFTNIPSAGTTTITATFTPTDTVDFTSATTTAQVTVTRATPVITFPTPPTAIVGTPLSSIQLNPTVTGVAGPNLPGAITFTPNTGLVTSGPQTLNVTFTPADTIDYNLATTTVTLNGAAVTLASLSSSTAQLGDPARTITLTGTGFVTNSTARANGAALTTTFVNATTLTAVVPASNFLAIQTLQITVFNPTQNQTTAALPFTVTPAGVGAITFSGPTTANSGDQPSIRFALTNPYPVDLTATVTLTFAPIAGGVDDPAIQFRNGRRTFSFTLTAGQTASPTIQLQSGTVAGTIQVSLALFITNSLTNVTPASVAPILINIPPAAPVITSITVTRTGRQLTVNTFGLSNTRAITQASFHFTPAAGQQIQTQDIPLDVTSLFGGWYSQAVSATYGSTFLYTQTFTLDDDATVVGQVTLTLSNGVGVSASGSSN